MKTNNAMAHALKNKTALIAFMAINALFVAKYSMRVVAWWPLLVVFFCAVYLLGAWWVGRQGFFQRWPKLGVMLLVMAFVGMLVLQLAIDPMSLNVDRWSALSGPISYLLSGKFPYMAPTHLNGYSSPFPVWQIVHIPFYLLGNVAFSFFVVLVLFLYVSYKTRSVNHLGVAALLLTSPAAWYEAAVRSDLITNMMLVASTTLLLHKTLATRDAWLERHCLKVAVLCGLLLSTRFMAAVPLFILLFPYWSRLRPLQMLILPLTALLTFVITFVPFVLSDPQSFFHSEFSPWHLQTRQGNPLDVLFFVCLTLALSVLWQRKGAGLKVYCASVSVMLLCVVGITFLHNMVENNNFNLFSSTYDITYLSTALPWLVVCIASKEQPAQSSRCPGQAPH